MGAKSTLPYQHRRPPTTAASLRELPLTQEQNHTKQLNHPHTHKNFTTPTNPPHHNRRQARQGASDKTEPQQNLECVPRKALYLCIYPPIRGIVPSSRTIAQSFLLVCLCVTKHMFAKRVFAPRIVTEPPQNNKHYDDSRNSGRTPRVMSSCV